MGKASRLPCQRSGDPIRKCMIQQTTRQLQLSERVRFSTYLQCASALAALGLPVHWAATHPSRDCEGWLAAASIAALQAQAAH